MRILGWTIIAVTVIIILLVVGVLAGHVGGVAIRKQGAAADPLQLQVSEPVVRGVPVVVRWNATDAEVTGDTITFTWRDRTQEHPLGEAAVAAEEATVQFPCVGDEAFGSLVVRAKENGRVVGSRSVELGPPGPECI